MKGLRNKKGFTLIELLAVIIILAILMTLAITSMSGYITKAKKDTFVTTAQQYANAARLSVVNGEYENPGQGQCTVIKTNAIALESGEHESSFDQAFDNDLSFIVVKNAGTGQDDKYEYYIQMVDAKGNGFVLIAENALDANKHVFEKVISTTATDTLNKATTIDASANTIAVNGTACPIVEVIEPPVE